MQKLSADKNRVVALRYIMRNSRGEILEDTMNSSPVNYLHGSPAILPMLQKQLQDMKAGDKKQIIVAKQNSEADDDFVFDVIIDDVRAALPEEIALGYPVSITAEICKDDCDCYDEESNKQ